MKYLCLVYVDEKEMDTVSKEEYAGRVSESMNFVQKLRDDDRCLAVERLERTRKAATVRVRNGKLSVTDGPFAETKEQLAGFLLITAKDLNEATRLAAQFPGATFGTVEVRAIVPLNAPRPEEKEK